MEKTPTFPPRPPTTKQQNEGRNRKTPFFGEKVNVVAAAGITV